MNLVKCSLRALFTTKKHIYNNFLFVQEDLEGALAQEEEAIDEETVSSRKMKQERREQWAVYHTSLLSLIKKVFLFVGLTTLETIQFSLVGSLS